MQKDLLAWGAWVLEVTSNIFDYLLSSNWHWSQTTGAMGFRLDAIKHMDRRFLLEFVREAYGSYLRLVTWLSDQECTEASWQGEPVCSSRVLVCKVGSRGYVCNSLLWRMPSVNMIKPYIRTFEGLVCPSSCISFIALWHNHLGSCRFSMFRCTITSTTQVKLVVTTTFGQFWTVL